MNALRDFRASLTLSTLGFVFASLIGLGAIIAVSAEAGLILYTDTLYVIGENLLIIGSILGIAFAVLTSRRADVPDQGETRELPLRGRIAIGVAAFGGAALLMMRYQDGLSLYNAGIGLLIALSLFIALQPFSADETTAPQSPVGMRFLYGGIVMILALTCLLRLVASPNVLLTYLLAPLMVFILPGLALALAVREENTPIFVHLALIPVLSIASQMIVVAWMLWLRIPVTAFTLLAGCAVITLGGLAAHLLPKWRSRRTIN